MYGMRACMYLCMHSVRMYLYCIVSIHLYGASCSAHQSEALPVREAKREESRGFGCHRSHLLFYFRLSILILYDFLNFLRARDRWFLLQKALFLSNSIL